MLNYVYPRPAPSLSSLRFGTVKALFAASRRYEVWRAIDASVAQLKTLCPAQPFVVYAIAMAARQESLGPRGGKVALVSPSSPRRDPAAAETDRMGSMLARRWQRRLRFTR